VALIQRVHFPGPPLSEFVELIWLYEGYTAPHAFERLMPTGTMSLVINLHEDRSPIYHPERLELLGATRGILLAGIYSEFAVIDTAEQWATLGVHFRPGGAFSFFGLPAGELQNTTLSLEDLWGPAANGLRDRILEAATPEARFGIMEEALLARARGLSRHPAIAFALRELRQSRTVGSVLDQVGYSQRHFIQLFRQEVGLTPKLYGRIQRFQRVLRQIMPIRQVDWPGLALDCGFFDQAHLIRDFRAFSGFTPSEYLERRGSHFNHVPVGT
jgi:AraC-like DNA-binding protein